MFDRLSLLLHDLERVERLRAAHGLLGKEQFLLIFGKWSDGETTECPGIVRALNDLERVE